MYDKLVKDLRNMSKMGVKYGMAAIKMRKAADAIEELCALCASLSKDCSEAIAKYLELWEKQPRWIPCSERLPEEDKTVLTFVKKHQCVLLDWMHDNKWCCFGVADYWMPLPEPPEEET